jgi:hypothetical protein
MARPSGSRGLKGGNLPPCVARSNGSSARGRTVGPAPPLDPGPPGLPTRSPSLLGAERPRGRTAGQTAGRRDSPAGRHRASERRSRPNGARDRTAASTAIMRTAASSACGRVVHRAVRSLGRRVGGTRLALPAGRPRGGNLGAGPLVELGRSVAQTARRRVNCRGGRGELRSVGMGSWTGSRGASRWARKCKGWICPSDQRNPLRRLPTYVKSLV